MKAESIEQIREHLAKGGMILRGKSWDTIKWRVYMPPTALDDGWEYELLPLEEKEPVDHGTQKGQAKDGRDPMPCELNREAYLDLLREDFDWLVEQPRSLEREHIKEVLSWLMKNRPDGTQKGQEEKPKRGAWLEFADDGKLVTDVMHEPKDAVMPDSFVWCEEAGIHETEWRQRIRQRLLHGQWPEMSDLMDWWEATTGERIEWGKRCDKCECSGEMPSPSSFRLIECNKCNGAGYSVRPTWMEEGK